MAAALPCNCRQFGRYGRAAALTGRSRTIHLVYFWLNCFYAVLAQELCHCGHGLLLSPRSPGLERLHLGPQAQPMPRSGLCPQPQDPSRAKWEPWLSHRWTGCPIAALPGLPATSGARVPRSTAPPGITGWTRGIQETSSSRPLRNNPCYWMKETMCGFSCLSLPGYRVSD